MLHITSTYSELQHFTNHYWYRFDIILHRLTTRLFTTLMDLAAANLWWCHDMETFSALLALVMGIQLSLVNSRHKDQKCGALILLFWLDCTSCWTASSVALIWDAMTFIWCYTKKTCLIIDDRMIITGAQNVCGGNVNWKMRSIPFCKPYWMNISTLNCHRCILCHVWHI